MTSRTPLHDKHVAAGGRMVDFAGWDMPVHYGSQMEEHHAVRNAAGMFDVSHMTVVDLSGEQTRDYLRYLLANDVARLDTPGRALYTCMLNERGGVIDDLIVYWRGGSQYRLVVNAATRVKDLQWLDRHAGRFGVAVAERSDLAMIAVQGPQARERAAGSLPAAAREPALALKPFRALAVGEWLIARTGYTGEDGFEIILPNDAAAGLWDALAGAGVTRCGLGARDTLRLEAGLNLYGQDMDEDVTPLESGLGWTIAWDPPERDFIGRAALAAQKADGTPSRFVGLVLAGRGVLRAGQKVHTADGEGITTSGTFSPTMSRAIALARVPASTGADCEVEIRGRRLPAFVVKPPFVRNGRVKVKLDKLGD